ncbi:MAG TPA: ParM/StbA family protein [Gammaproteobacteria bacterium]|nr:ParM/StbA family protein [Gammaproteobacteria bacterium]
MAIGIDVGYSNLKIVAGTGHSPAVAELLPAGAGPVEALPDALGGGHIREGRTVHIGGQPWVAGIEPYRLHGRERDIHDDYTATKAYRALLLAALDVAGDTVIRHLVTGLPVSHYQDTERRKRLTHRIRGTHAIDSDRRVSVERVTLLPQPIGAYVDASAHDLDPAILNEGRVLVVDVGFFSFDWALIEDVALVSQVSGTSLEAVSRLLDNTDEIIRAEHGERVGAARIEAALRQRASHVLLHGERIQLQPILSKAAAKTAQQAIGALRQMQRGQRPIDLVILTGGGAGLYRDAVQALFPKTRVFTPPEPWLANARGFWRYARRREERA